jgi:transcriptional regulator with XRE-family HTH domain
MGKLKTRALSWRYAYAAKLGRQVTQQEIADAIQEDRRQVARVENNDMQRAPMDVLRKLSAFYHEQGIDTSIVMEYDPNGQRAHHHAELVAA